MDDDEDSGENLISNGDSTSGSDLIGNVIDSISLPNYLVQKYDKKHPVFFEDIET